jgi:hypothetical protein
MEFANIQYLTGNGVPGVAGGERVPPYQEALHMPRVLVDDYLQVHPESANLALLQRYSEEGYRLIPIQRRPLTTRPKSAALPARVLLELTSRCNLLCVMCPRNVLTRPQIDMPKEIAMRCLDELDAHGVEGVWLYNIGESMLHPDFEEIFLYCQRKSHLGSLWLSTNGQTLTDRHCALLIGSNLTFLNYSLNAMNEAVYKAVSPSGDYGAVLANLAKLMQMKTDRGHVGRPPWIRLQMIDQPQAAGQIDAFLSGYAARAEILSVNLLEAFNRSVESNVAYAQTRLRAADKRCRRIDREDAFIFADGEVGFCDTDFNHVMSIGNIGTASLETIWGGKARRRYRALNSSGRLDESALCRTCLDYDL